MKVKDLIKELEYFYLQDEDIDILGYLHDEDLDVVYICEICVEGNVKPTLALKEIRRY